MPNRLAFTVRALERMAPPASDRTWVYDTKTPGLALMHTAAGSKAFYVYRRIGGRPERIRLGGFPEMTVEQARKAAAKVNGRVAEGVNVANVKRANRGEMTLGELWTVYLEQHAKPHKKPRSIEEDERQWGLYLSPWRTRRLSEIQRQHVANLHATVGKDRGHYAANRMLALLSKMFSFAADVGFDKPNPCRGLRKFKEERRERFLQAAELRPFFEALRAHPNQTVRDFILMALFTGARRRNVQAMRWADVDLQAGTWTLADTKTGRQVIHLPEPAMAILRDRSGAVVGPWVFPGYGASGHIEEPKTAWKMILERAGIADLRIHDLRRTLGSWQAATGASLPVIGKSLGHRNASTTAIYARLELDPVRQAVDTATTAMLAAAGVAPKRRKKAGAA